MSLVEKILSQHYPYLLNRWFSPLLLRVLCTVLPERDVQQLFDSLPQGNPYDYIDEILHRFNFSYQVRGREHSNVPDIGSVVVVANHPIGSLDGLALMQMLHQIRPDIKVLAADILSELTPLDSLLIPMNYETGQIGSTSRGLLANFMRHGVLIIFPAREVSRIRRRDRFWQTEFLEIARKFRAPIVPIHIKADNSLLFYLTSWLSKRLSRLMLVRETWRMRGKTIRLTIGNPVDYDVYSATGLSNADLAALFRRHLFRIGRARPGLLQTRPGIVPPRPRELISQEIRDKCEHLVDFANGFSLYLCTDIRQLSLLHEIGRNREYSFRYVGQGSGKRLDTDAYDEYYHHLILWDKENRSVIGSYRLLPTTVAAQNKTPLYTQSLFRFKPESEAYLKNSLELGRSFILPRYWGSRALEYLWAGIAMYMSRCPDLSYLIGSVSFSASHSDGLAGLLIQHYSHYYPSPFHPKSLIEHVNPCTIDDDLMTEIGANLPTGDEHADMRRIKKIYAEAGLVVPTLFRHYAGLCNTKTSGVSFFAFGHDGTFSNCYECFLMLDSTKINRTKLAHYQSLAETSDRKLNG